MSLSKTAFAIAAHPDDIEFLMAGTLLLLRQAGYELHYMNLANGCCGTTQFDRATIIRKRKEEAKAAAELAGAEFHESICDDLSIFYEPKLLARLASIVREVSPQIVLTHSPSDYMEDHANTSRLTATAAFSRGMPNFPVDPPRPAVDQPVTVYHAQPYGNRDPLNNLVLPDVFVDITGVIDAKVEMLARHESQKKWLDESQGLDSYLDCCRELSRDVGKMSAKYEYAEGWRRRLHLGFCGPQDDPLCDALAENCFSGPAASDGLA